MDALESGRKVDEEVPAGEARDRLTELMNRSNIANDRFLLTVHGNRVAALVSVRDYERLRALPAA